VWVAAPRDDDGRKHYLGTRKLKRDAQDLIDAFYDQDVQARDTIGQYLRDWTDRYPRSERTDATNLHRIGRVLDVQLEDLPLRAWPLAELRRKHAYALVDHMLRDQGRALTGVRGILGALSTMAEDAITDELMGSNPFKGVKLRSNDRRAQKAPRKPRVWTFAQMHEFAAAGGAYQAMIRILADCGLRVGEMLALQRELQDLRAGAFKVWGTAWHGKLIEPASDSTKRHDREGPIPPTCLTLLRSMPTRIDSPWLFSTPGSRREGKTGFDRPGGLMWRYDNWRRMVWLPACETSGMDPTPQEFRASFNSQLLAAGVDRADLADLLGHSEDVNAARYTRALRRSGDQIRAVIG
jgi:integrase